MKTIQVETINGIVERNVYNIKEIPWHEYALEKTLRKHNTDYLNLVATYDIETTTLPYNDRYYAFMYHWQFCIGEHVIFGRRWEEFTFLIDYMMNKLLLSKGRKLVIYVHNLGFEYQFMKRFFKWSDLMCSSNGSIMKVCMNGCIEWRCSAKLSNMSLEKFCENSEGVTFYKLSGDKYDYNKLRTPDTPMEMYELGYCYNDVYGLKQCIDYRLKNDDITTIPLTSTGYVRRTAREYMRRNKRNRTLFEDTKLNLDLYTLFTEIFRGGDTHANYKYANQVLDDIQSFDMQSAYPACMLMDKYPMTPFIKVNEDKFTRDWTGYTLIFRCIFINIRFRGKHGAPYIPLSKTKGTKRNERVVDNGRILQASILQISLTDIDFDIIKNDYEWDSYYIKDLYVSQLGDLPPEFKTVVLEYFKKKTELKGIIEHIYEYMKSKNELNSLYGMMVTAILRNIFYVDENGNIQEREDTDKTPEQLIEEYYKSRNSFLPYQWGVYVTANCRKRLHEGISIMGKYHVYNDTDSAKGDGDFRKEFQELNKKTIAIAEANGYYAYDKYGKKQYPGIWEHECTYRKFITLGSKKYLVETEDGKIESTIAGVSKKAGQMFFKEHGMEAFKIGTTIPNSGHLIAYYNEDDIHNITVEGCTFQSASNVALVDGGYTIGVTNEYLDLLEQAVKEAYSQV